MKFACALVAGLAAIACAAARSGSPLVSLGPLPAREALNGKPGVVQAGVHRKLNASLLRKGKCDKDGWKLVIRSPGAKGVRLHFTATDLTNGKLVVAGADGVEQTFQGRGPNGDGDFWTGLITGDSAALEWRTTSRAPLPFKILRLSHLWALP